MQQYDLKTNTLKSILQTGIFYKSYKTKSGNLFLHLGTIVEATSNSKERIEPVNQIDIYLKSDLSKKTHIKFDFSFERFIVSENEINLYLIKDNQIWIYSLSEKKIIDRAELNDKARIAQVFDKQQLFLSYDYDKPNIITCWKF